MTQKPPFTLGAILNTKKARNGGEIVLFQRTNYPFTGKPYATIWRDDKNGSCYHGHYDLNLAQANHDFASRT